MNSFAQAWTDAAKDLGITVVHPFVFKTYSGDMLETVGVYLPDFGSEHGTLLTCRFDSDEVMDSADETTYYQSALNPHRYEPYNQANFLKALKDWGWYGVPEQRPQWL